MAGPVMVSSRGFSLMELIIVIVISGILAVGSARFIAHSAGGYVATGVRQGNAAAAVVATEKISRELRLALPNSVRRNASGSCIEFIPVLSASRYLSAPVAPAAAGTAITVVDNNYSLSGGVTEYLAIYPSSTGTVYVPGAASEVTASPIAAVSSSTITLGANHQFPADSPTRRLYIISDPVTYCYAAVSGQNGLFRYSGYGFNAAVASPPAGGTRQLLINNVSGNVSFEVVPATLTRNALVEFSFQVSRDVQYSATDESINISHEVQIRNVP